MNQPKMISFKKKLKIGTLTLLFLIVGVITFINTKDIIYGTNIKITNVEDGQTFTEPFIKLSGVAKNFKNLSINDRKIFTDQTGIFNENLLLLPGYNIITIKGEDKFGKTRQKVYQLILSAKGGN